MAMSDDDLYELATRQIADRTQANDADPDRYCLVVNPDIIVRLINAKRDYDLRGTFWLLMCAGACVMLTFVGVYAVRMCGAG